MTTLIESTARLALGIEYARMEREDIDAIKRLLLDTLGCALGAVGCAPERLLRDLLSPLSDADGDARASLLGGGEPASLADAILVNGTLARYLDLNDVYWARDVCHPSENIPVALACAQAARRSGRALIEAIAVGYEVQIRLADALSFEAIGLHHVSAAGFVSPLIMARLWNLNAAQAAHAAALGGFRHLTHASLVRGQLSMAKAIGYAAASSECVLSTRLAASGFSGPLTVMEDLGIGAIDLTAGTSGARRVSLKRFPVQFALQSPVEAALELLPRIPGGAPAVRELHVEVTERTQRRTADAAKLAPTSRETADHSLACCVAMALLDGKLEEHQFTAGRWAHDDVLALMQRVQVSASAELESRWPGGRPASLTAVLHDGSRHTVRVAIPHGDASRPMDDAAVESKFLGLASPLLGTDGADAVIRTVRRIEELEDVGVLCRLLAPPTC